MAVPAIPNSFIWIMTKRCAWNCKDCSKITYPEQELTEQDIHKVLSVVKNLDQEVHLTIYGGDIFSWELQKLVKFVKKLQQFNYTLVTAISPKDYGSIKALKKFGLKNLVVSSEPVDCPNKQVQELKFSELVGRLLPVIALLSGVDIIVDRRNIASVPSKVRWLSKLGVKTTISFHVTKQSHVYDFGYYEERLTFGTKDYFWVNGVMNELIELKKQGFLLQTSYKYLKNFAKSVCLKNRLYFCGGMVNLVINTNGSLKPCLYLQGDEIKRHNILTWRADNLDCGMVHVDWRDDVKNQCRGCYWREQFELEQLINLDKTERDFGKIIKRYFGG